MDGSYVHSSNTYPPVVTYTALYFTGQLVVGGVEYDGGFYIAGMSEIGWGASGPCGGVCLTGGTSYQGGDPGAIHGFDPNYGAVTGACSIVDEFDSFTGPAFLIEVDRQLSIACSGSVQGGPLTAFTLNVIAHSDGINDVVGAYTVS